MPTTSTPRTTHNDVTSSRTSTFTSDPAPPVSHIGLRSTTHSVLQSKGENVATAVSCLAVYE